MASEQIKLHNEMWAIVELMGHGQTAGLIRQSDLGGLLRLDVPLDKDFRTEYYGEQAIYAIRIVSEEIARAYALPNREICAYNEPIVPRAQYEEALTKARNYTHELQDHITELERRLTKITSTPALEGTGDKKNNGPEIPF